MNQVWIQNYSTEKGLGPDDGWMRLLHLVLCLALKQQWGPIGVRCRKWKKINLNLEAGERLLLHAWRGQPLWFLTALWARDTTDRWHVPDRRPPTVTQPRVTGWSQTVWESGNTRRCCCCWMHNWSFLSFSFLQSASSNSVFKPL